MKGFILFWILSLLLFVSARENKGVVKLKKGDLCPEYVFLDRDSNRVKLQQFKDKFIVIDVWASWCYPCKKEYPVLKALANKYKEYIIFISISCDRSERRWRNEMGFMGAEGNQWWIAGNNDFMLSFEIFSIPRFILLEPGGKILNLYLPKPSDPQFEEVLTRELIKRKYQL